MKITLLQNTSLEVCAKAVRTCWDSHHLSDNGGDKDKELIKRVGCENKHGSVLEHLFYTFSIEGISRACLQELARHRIASLSVKSTRYTLKELLKAKDLNTLLVQSDDIGINELNLKTLQGIKGLLAYKDYAGKGLSADKVKYLLPEAYKTSLVWSINARSLQNFLTLRSSKGALKEIRELSFKIYEALPDTHKYLFKDFICRDEKNIKIKSKKSQLEDDIAHLRHKVNELKDTECNECVEEHERLLGYLLSLEEYENKRR